MFDSIQCTKAMILGQTDSLQLPFQGWILFWNGWNGDQGFTDWIKVESVACSNMFGLKHVWEKGPVSQWMFQWWIACICHVIRLIVLTNRYYQKSLIQLRFNSLWCHCPWCPWSFIVLNRIIGSLFWGMNTTDLWRTRRKGNRNQW